MHPKRRSAPDPAIVGARRRVEAINLCRNLLYHAATPAKQARRRIRLAILAGQLGEDDLARIENPIIRQMCTPKAFYRNFTEHRCSAKCEPECDQKPFLEAASAIVADPAALARAVASANGVRIVTLRSAGRTMLDARAIHADCIGPLLKIVADSERSAGAFAAAT